MAIRCGTCFVAEPFMARLSDPAMVRCRLNPPVPIVDGNGFRFVLPVCRPTEDFCGQWQPRAGFDAEGNRKAGEPQPASAQIIKLQ